MNALSSRRFITSALILLILLNVTLLGLLWWQNMHEELPEAFTFSREAERPSYAMAQLSLDERQEGQFRNLRRSHFIKVRSDMQAIASLKRELIAEAFIAEPDTSRISGLSQQIGRHQAAIERELTLHFHELAKVCKPGQSDSLRIMLEGIMTRKASIKDRQWQHGH